VSEGTVDEDIYEMGERKRKLTQAVLSENGPSKTAEVDSEAQKNGHKKKPEEDENEELELNIISKILSKALNKK
jgi:SNF2 family DNA or RNA helicase